MLKTTIISKNESVHRYEHSYILTYQDYLEQSERNVLGSGQHVEYPLPLLAKLASPDREIQQRQTLQVVVPANQPPSGDAWLVLEWVILTI